MAEPATQIDVTTVLGEIMAGGGLTLAQAGKLFPSHRGGGHTDPATVWRWARTGTRTPDGRIVRLEVVRVGVRWLTSRAAVTRYVGALTNVPAGAAAPTAKQPPAVRSKRAARASKKLAALGA